MSVFFFNPVHRIPTPEPWTPPCPTCKFTCSLICHSISHAKNRKFPLCTAGDPVSLMVRERGACHDVTKTYHELSPQREKMKWWFRGLKPENSCGRFKLVSSFISLFFRRHFFLTCFFHRAPRCLAGPKVQIMHKCTIHLHFQTDEYSTCCCCRHSACWQVLPMVLPWSDTLAAVVILCHYLPLLESKKISAGLQRRFFDVTPKQKRERTRWKKKGVK